MNVTHLYCSACGKRYEPRKLYQLMRMRQAADGSLRPRGGSADLNTRVACGT